MIMNELSLQGQDKETDDHFSISSEKAAEILGINRSRLSQLTSKGIFPYERKKILNHNRLFYRLIDLLNYQRLHTNNHFTSIQTKKNEEISDKQELDKNGKRCTIILQKKDPLYREKKIKPASEISWLNRKKEEMRKYSKELLEIKELLLVQKKCINQIGQSLQLQRQALYKAREEIKAVIGKDLITKINKKPVRIFEKVEKEKKNKIQWRRKKKSLFLTSAC